jgi:UDPglucose 6-dehydrogenase
MPTKPVRKKVAVIGYGYVGKAVKEYFDSHFDVLIYDIAMPLESASKDEINEADLAVISVPTAMKKDGTANLSAVESTLKWLQTPFILIKSTVPPGTTRMLSEKYDKKIAFSPEYIGEGHYHVPFWKGYPDPTDMKRHDFMIVGGPKEVTIPILSFFKTVQGAEPRYMQTDSTTAELVKYMENSFLATKVTFCNEFFNISEALGIDYDELRELWLMDGRVGRSHTAVFRDKRGFGGKCLPKDVNALVQASVSAGYNPRLLKAVLGTNDRIREVKRKHRSKAP